MAKNLKPTNTQRKKILALKPVLDDWNRVQNDCWAVTPLLSENYKSDSCTIHRQVSVDNPNIHGLLMTDIAGICNAYGWTWAVYADYKNGIEVNL